MVRIALLTMVLMWGCGGPEVSEAKDARSEPDPRPQTEPTPDERVTGVDVSHFVGHVDWKQVAVDGHRFAFAKASQGVDFEDPYYRLNRDGARAAGLHFGAYHYYQTNDDPEDQARFFIKTSGLLPGDLPPVVDIENLAKNSRAGWHEELKLFVAELERYYGVKPIIYTSPRFWNTEAELHFGDHPLWIAQYDVEQPMDPDGWERWTFWQTTQHARVEGVTKDVDSSLFNGGFDALRSMRIPQHKPSDQQRGD